ncbi:FMN reductase [Variovorax sp. Sphag1AA]|uniref:FMN reductase n=1 Tax=Variovorax sp. Sphag1AA TaxID=2587027 RepID=UPI00161C82BB|nr:FMN reductase [Variovorax sp. Sphag1AA]MBB3181479.1 FMN reductase [Variovorax sp. Sphag1AA]
MSQQVLKVVALSGGLQRPSRTLALVEELVEGLSQALPVQARVVELGELVPHFGSVLYRKQLPEQVEDALQAIESADLIVAASPVFRGAYSGLFKHLLDFVHQDALVDKLVLLAATGGSERHALVIDHQLRPLFSFFQSRTLPIGVYATDTDFSNYAVSSEALRARITLAVERAIPPLRQIASARAATAARAPLLALA